MRRLWGLPMATRWRCPPPSMPGQVSVKVTERVKPGGRTFLPTRYGEILPQYQSRANGYGLNMMDFIPLHLEPGAGSTMSQEVAVKVRKVEA